MCYRAVLRMRSSIQALRLCTEGLTLSWLTQRECEMWDAVGDCFVGIPLPSSKGYQAESFREAVIDR